MKSEPARSPAQPPDMVSILGWLGGGAGWLRMNGERSKGLLRSNHTGLIERLDFII